MDSGPRSHGELIIEEIEMIDLIKKALYTGVGLAVLTKEKAEELVQELTQAGEALGAGRQGAVRRPAEAVGGSAQRFSGQD